MTLYSFVLLINYVSGIWLHDFHVSVTQINHDTENQKLKIKQRIFVDDFETAITQANKLSFLDLLSDFEKEEVKTYIKKYAQNNLQIKVNQKPVDIVFLGSKVDGDAIVIYSKVEKIKKLKSIEVQNSTLLELFRDQVNLIHIDVNKINRSMKLDIDNSSEMLEF